MESFKIFDAKFLPLIDGAISGVRNIAEDAVETESVVEVKHEIVQEVDTKSLTCSYCRAKFSDVERQREHYKLDWHRYNLKQSLRNRSPIPEEQFSERNDDLSSISGSDSEKEDNADIIAAALGRIFLQNAHGTIFSVYKSLLVDKKTDLNPSELKTRLTDIRTNSRWAVLMLGGGHFAGAVFHGEEPYLHKTLHCYTVRAGQGGAQSSRDSKSASSAPKSAGASIRRYNEAAFVQYVTDVIENWAQDIRECSLVFYRAAGTYNKSILFGGKNPLMDRADGRLRSIPFSTRRATFTEVKRVHSLLSIVTVYDNLEAANKEITKYQLPESKRAKLRTSPVNRAKSRDLVERQLPSEPIESSDESVDGFELSNLQISFTDALQAFDESPRPKTQQRKPKKSKTQKLLEAEEARKDELRTIIKNGDVETLKMVLKTGNYIDSAVDAENNTLMHFACLHHQIGVLTYLLAENADVCVKNKSQQTPYTCTQHKDVRDLLKKFALDNPDRYNYNKAQIPVIRATTEEAEERKRQQKRAKREKEKEKRKEKAELQKEQIECEKFAGLSDREKRALAAERRILSQAGVVIARCFLCGSDMSGKVPFEYSGNRFCSVDCLKAHRIKNPVKLS